MQEVLPDFFSEHYHRKASSYLESKEGITLSNFLAGRVFHEMAQDLFEQQLPSRSEDLVERVREYMQDVFVVLCETVCAPFPRALRRKIDEMVMVFLSEIATRCKGVISSLCRAELAWTFTQNDSYYDVLGLVDGSREKVSQLSGRDLHGVPKEFVKLMADITEPQGGGRKRDVFNLQVRSCSVVHGDFADGYYPRERRMSRGGITCPTPMMRGLGPQGERIIRYSCYSLK